MNRSIVAMLVAVASPASVQDVGAPLTGWWRAKVTHRSESQEVFLHFEQRDGKPFVRFSIPLIGADDSPLGPYKVDGKQLILPAAGWILTLNDAGNAFSGTIPADIVPVYQMKARFERSEPPVQPTVKPSGQSPEPVWTTRLDGSIFGPLGHDDSTKSVIAGTVKGTVVALAESDGRHRWSTNLGSPIHAAATIGFDGIYIATDRGVAKLGRQTGQVVWTRDFSGPVQPHKAITDPQSRWDHFASSVALSGGLAIVGSRDGCVYALRQRDGFIDKRICTKDVIASTPIVSGGNLYFSSFDNHLYAVDLESGTSVWTADLKAPAPGDLAVANGRIIAGSRAYDLSAHDPATGKTAWSNYFWFSWIDSAPVIDRGQLLVGSSDGLRVFAIDPQAGGTLWSTFIGGWAWSRPAADARTVYAGAVGNPNVPYIGPRVGGLAAIDRRTGQLMWLFRPPYDPKAAISGFASGPVVAGNRLVAADLDGNVYALPTS